MPEDRLTEYLDGLDAAAEWTPIGVDVPMAFWTRPRRMDMGAHGAWRAAWLRGLVSDVEMAWYQSLINRHPASWLGWIKWVYGVQQ